jgi:PPOX class probable F420-dependent enzyme
VPTPVNCGLSEDGARLYFRSELRSAKVRRLQRDPHVRVCPCNLFGKPKGRVVECTARVLDPGEAAEAEAAVASNWSAPMKPLERGLDRMPLEIAYVEITPAVPATSEEVR